MTFDPSELKLSILEGTETEVTALHEVLQGAEDYSMSISGARPTRQDACDVFQSIPHGVPRANKHVVGICLGSRMVGVADVIQGYPTPDHAYIGLLLLSLPFRNKGLGSGSLCRIEQMAREWCCKRLRLSVVEANGSAASFWLRCGFVDTGVRVPYQSGSVISQSMIFEKSL